MQYIFQYEKSESVLFRIHVCKKSIQTSTSCVKIFYGIIEQGLKMIKGIGTDIIEVERVKKAVLDDNGFIERLFSNDEIDYCNSKSKREIHFAARFAAKEAFFKALGTGWRDGMKWEEISVKNDKLGKPEVELQGKTLDIFRKKNMEKINLSISHTKLYAVAFVVIE